jgi:hypothetical protein
MGEQRGFRKAGLATRGLHRGGNAGQLAEQRGFGR